MLAGLQSAPAIGLFWFVRAATNGCKMAYFKRPFDDVPTIGGFKTLDEGHVDLWPKLQSRERWLQLYEYEEFPRGRVNWRAEDDRYLLLLDSTIASQAFVAHIVERFCLPEEKLIIFTDPHYRSNESVAAPAAVRH